MKFYLFLVLSILANFTNLSLAIVSPQPFLSKTYARSRMPGDLYKLYRKIGATKASINFLTRCRKFKLIPRGFRSKIRIQTKKSNQMEDRFSRIRMRECLNSLHAKLMLLDLDIKINPQRTSYKLTVDELNRIRDREYFKRMKTVNDKFSKLISKRPKKAQIQYKTEAVINLSSQKLSPRERTGPSQRFQIPTFSERVTD